MCTNRGGDYKSDPYITLDINDALDHLEKYHGKKFANTVTVTCTSISHWFSSSIPFTEGTTNYTADMGYYAYKVDKGLLMANIRCNNATMRMLNRSNLYSGDGWRLLGPRELSKYILSDLNGTINPKVNPWNIMEQFDDGKFCTFYQTSHNAGKVPCLNINKNEIGFVDGAPYDLQYGWQNIDKNNYGGGNRGDMFYTSLFLYQYVESENATNIYY